MIIWPPSMRKVYTISATIRSWLALISIVCIGYFFIIVLISHVLRPDVQPLRNAVSNYATGPYGFLMVSAFFALALAMAAIVLGLAGELPPTRRTQYGATLLFIASVGLVVVGIFPGDVHVPHPPATITGLIHWIAAGTSFLSITIAAFLFSDSFKEHKDWQSFHRPALGLSIASVIATAVFGVLALTGWVGLGERIYLPVALLWPLLTTIRMKALISRKITLRHA